MSTSSDPDHFVRLFRQAAPYIRSHRGQSCVVAFGGGSLQAGPLRRRVQDLALLHSLGLRLVLVVGARPQIEARLAARGHASRIVRGRRVTDAVALACLKESVGSIRLELEGLFSMGVSTSTMAGARLRVVTGNFVAAQALGVIDGVDHEHTGQVRRIDHEAVTTALDAGAIVLLGPLGYARTGEVFNLEMRAVATEAAVALGAHKLIFLRPGGALQRGGAAVPFLELDEAQRWLQENDSADADLQAAVAAVRAGVPRAHLLADNIDGALLRELFTQEGSGTMVCNAPFEGVRAATLNDIPALVALLEPLEQEGILVPRSRTHLERDIATFVVAERDGRVVACAALHLYEDAKLAEVAALAVHPDCRGSGRGEALLDHLEGLARRQQMHALFVLTTRTAQWFLERGFVAQSPEALPPERRARLNAARGSKVLRYALAAGAGAGAGSNGT
ncbi:MAG: amino-acid N-acetyltransferase [Polyangiales bacterium]